MSRKSLQVARAAVSEAEGLMEMMDAKQVSLESTIPAVVEQHQRALSLLLDHLDEVQKRLLALEGRK